MLESVENRRHEGPRGVGQFLSSSFDSFQSHVGNRYVKAHRSRKERKDSMLLYTKYVTERKENMLSHSVAMDTMHKSQHLKPAIGYSKVDTYDSRTNQFGVLPVLERHSFDGVNYTGFHPRSLTKKGMGISPKGSITFRSQEKPSESPSKLSTPPGAKGPLLRGKTFPSPDNPFLLVNHSHGNGTNTVMATDFIDLDNAIRAPVNTPRRTKRRDKEKQAWSEPVIETNPTPRENTSPKTSAQPEFGNIQLTGVFVQKHTKRKPVKVTLEKRKPDSQRKLHYNPNASPPPIGHRNDKQDKPTDKLPAIVEDTSKEDDISSKKPIELSEETLKNAINTLKAMEKELDAKKKAQRTKTSTNTQSEKGKRKRLKLPRQKLDPIVEDESETSDSDSSRRGDTDTLTNPSQDDIISDESVPINGMVQPKLSEDVLENLLTLASNFESQGVRVDILKPISPTKCGVARKTVLNPGSPVRQGYANSLTRKERAMGDIRNKMKQRKEYTLRNA